MEQEGSPWPYTVSQYAKPHQMLVEHPQILPSSILSAQKRWDAVIRCCWYPYIDLLDFHANFGRCNMPNWQVYLARGFNKFCYIALILTCGEGSKSLLKVRSKCFNIHLIADQINVKKYADGSWFLPQPIARKSFCDCTGLTQLVVVQIAA